MQRVQTNLRSNRNSQDYTNILKTNSNNQNDNSKIIDINPEDIDERK